MRAVKRHPDFERDYLAQLDWLVAKGDRGRVAELARGVREVSGLIGALPGVGSRLGESDDAILRKLIFPKGPFVAWYVYDPSNREGDVWLVRLFHARQRRAKPGTWTRRKPAP